MGRSALTRRSTLPQLFTGKLQLTLPLLLCALAAPVLSHESHPVQPPWQSASAWPDRIIATLSGPPATSFSVNWRTNTRVSVALAELAPAVAGSRFDLLARTVKGETQRVELEHFDAGDLRIRELHNAGLPAVNYHAVTFDGLEPDTLYAYRVRGEAGKWSAWRQLRTAALHGPLSFVFHGDAQTGIRSHITRVFDTAARVAPHARFAIHGGDLVNTAMYDREWAEWFAALGATHVLRPALPVAGNHDYINITRARNSRLRDSSLHDAAARSAEAGQDEKLFVAEKSISPLWRPQFTLPVASALPPELAETVYDIRYQHNLHVFILDSSGIAFPEQLRWLEAGVSASDAHWKVVAMHHPLFSHVGGGEHPEHRRRREALVATLRRIDVDLVLTGHRHSYQRGVIGDRVARYNVGDEQSVRTVFVITAASTKRGESKADGWRRYSQQSDGEFALTRYADNVPIFAVFDIDGEELVYRAIDAIGEQYDGFSLYKTEDGNKRLVNHPSAFLPIKDRSNTVNYIPWDDLR